MQYAQAGGLPVRNFRDNFLANMHRKFKNTFLVAGRAEASAFAGEGNEQAVLAIRNAGL